MAKRNVRRPTEDIAIARVMAQKGNPSGDPDVLQKVIMDEDGVKYLVQCFHNKVDIPISHLWGQWREHRESMNFVDFLVSHGIIYTYRKAS